MARRQYIPEQKKLQIADLYENSNLSIGAIADKLRVSVRTVHNYKNYNGQDKVSSSDLQPESYDQYEDDRQEIEEDDRDIDSEEEVEDDEQGTETIKDYEPSEEESIEDTEEPTCQNCGTPKSKWWTIDQAVHYGWRTKEKELWAWDYVCPKCESPQSLKKCPDCGANISHFININETDVSKEQKQKYDFVCSNCNELINIDDL